MLPVVTLPAISRVPRRPRARRIGLVLLAAAAVIAPTVAASSWAASCDSPPSSWAPLGPVLVLLIAVAGSTLLPGFSGATAVAPALALGAGLPLLAGAVGDWLWLSQASCAASMHDAAPALLVLRAGAALAVISTSAWLLYARDELEPWSGTQGVVSAGAAALTVVVLGIGLSALVIDSTEPGAVIIAFSYALPWALAVGLTGWLRRSPALAIVVGGALQLAWLVFAAH